MYKPKRSHTSTHRIKDSRFIAGAEPFHDPARLKRRIEEIRSDHPGCAHVVYALSVGNESSCSFAMSDDGEPKGTAGRPVLDVLRGSGVTNCLVTVVRYFGGTKLGTGGLVRAYGGAAKEVLEAVPVEKLVEKVEFFVEMPYEYHDPVRRALRQLDAEVTDEEFSEKVRVYGAVPTAGFSACADAIAELSRGAVTLEIR